MRDGKRGRENSAENPRSCLMGSWGHIHGHGDLVGSSGAELPCSPSAGILGALLVLVLCPSPAVSQISSWPSTPCQDPPLSVGKRDLSLKSLFQESGAADPFPAFPSPSTRWALEWGDPGGNQTSPGTQGTCTCRDRPGTAGCPCFVRACGGNLPGFRHNL